MDMRLPAAARCRMYAIVMVGIFHFLPALARADAPGPVIVIGIDGMTFDVLKPLIEAGRVPHFAKLMETGAHSILRSEEPMRSPALWTTIATGQPRHVHQIFDFVTGSPYWPKALRSSERHLVTSNMRHSPALWDLAGAAGRRSLIVGWLNTWPAQRIEGVMIAPYVALGESRQTSIKGKIYANVDRQTYPARVFPQIKSLIVREDSIRDLDIDRLAHVPPKNSPLYAKVPNLKRYLYTVRWSLASALTHVAMLENALRTGSLQGEGPFHLVMTYFDGADTLAHRFWLFRQTLPEIETRLRQQNLDPKLAMELKTRFGRVIDNYYVMLDTLIGRIQNAAGEKATLIVLSDHGWGSRNTHDDVDPHVPFDGEHRQNGVFIAAGPSIAAGTTLKTQSLYDIMPTTLYLLGLKIPAHLRGRVALDMVDKNYATKHPPFMAVSASAPNPINDPPVTDSQAHFRDQEFERLRSLGYIQ